MAKLFNLAGRTALVTGSSRGLGRAIATGLAEAGAAVVLNGADAGRLASATIGADLVRVLLGSQLEQEGQVDALQRGQFRLLRGVGGLRLAFKVCDIRLSRLLIGSNGSESLEIGARDRVADVDGRSLGGDLLLSGDGQVVVSRDRGGCGWNAHLLPAGCGPGPRVRGIEPAHRVAIGISDLLHQE